MVSYCPDGLTNLAQIIERWQRHSRRQPVIIVATTNGSEDDPIEALCESWMPCYRGSRDDVAWRIDNALRAYAPDAQYIARALADNPLVDVALADWHIDVLNETGADGLWYGPDHDRITYAGTTDVWSRKAWNEIVTKSEGDEREHPGLYYWRNLSRFSVVQIPLPMREYLAPVRTELDTPEDLAMFTELWRRWSLTESDPCIPTMWALSMLSQDTELSDINAGVEVKTQTKAVWPKGAEFLCDQCRSRLGGIISGDLEIRCSRCGQPRKFYSNKRLTRA
jgi:spore coat polysaccharide biosynthesis protein SpsF (cytidylyltransferase family)